jgi:RNA polymerase sigma-70 factor (ECF subfamily)
MTDSFELFCSLVRAQRDALFRVASSILRNDADAEDAVSEATLKAYIHFGRLRRVESFKPWIMKILVNESYAIARKRKSFEPLDNIPEETGEVPLSPADSLALWNAVTQLPE